MWWREYVSKVQMTGDEGQRVNRIQKNVYVYE
jgi:hypothetical protein